MGIRASRGRGMEPEKVQRQGRDSRRRGAVLRPRRTVFVSLSRICRGSDQRRTLWSKSDTTLRFGPVVLSGQRDLLLGLHSHLSRSGLFAFEPVGILVGAGAE